MTMLCQNCQQSREETEGQTYTFYYGNQTGRTVRSRGSTTHYKIGGSDKPFLCNVCVFAYSMQKRAKLYRNWGIFCALAACALGLIMLFGSDGNMGEIPWLAAGLVLAYALALFLMGGVEKKRVENQDFAALAPALRSFRGSSLAIIACKDAWQERGYHAFFTSQQMKRITRLYNTRRPAPGQQQV